MKQTRKKLVLEYLWIEYFEMKQTYPQSLAGLYQVYFTEFILKPVRLIDTQPSDQILKEIKFENGVGNAVFENGFVYALDVKFNERSYAYTFKYRNAGHIFEIKASLGGASRTVDIMSLTDLN